MSGTTRDVGGMISAKRRKNTVSDRRMEMLRATFSPLSDGRWKTMTVRREMATQGRMRFTVWKSVFLLIVMSNVISGR